LTVYNGQLNGRLADSLIPSVFTPSAWQFPIAYCLCSSLLPF